MNVFRAVVRGARRFVSWLFEDIKEIWSIPKPLLPEDRIPRNKRGEPDLSFYTKPLQHYIDLYSGGISTPLRGATPEVRRLAWQQRVHGMWGLLAKGQEALPFLLTLIGHPNPDAREDGYSLLGELKLDRGISEQLLSALLSEKDLTARSAVIEALGNIRYRPAIDALASILLDDEVDIDTRWNAADSLGKIAGQRFSGPDKLKKAEAWLAARNGTVREEKPY